MNTWDPKQVQIDGGWAAGLFQLENYRLKSGRWKNLDTFAKARGKSRDNASSQLDFMIYEASGGEPFIANNIKKYYSDGFNGFKQETDIDKATTVFEKAYEIAGNAYLQNRITAAIDIIINFIGNLCSTFSDILYMNEKVCILEGRFLAW